MPGAKSKPSVPGAPAAGADVSYYIDINPNYSLNIHESSVLSLLGLGPGA
jgi:hypothetical protein